MDRLRILLSYILIFFFLFSCKSNHTIEDDSLQENLPQGNWKLVWQDEFNGMKNSLPNKHWFFFQGYDENTIKWRDAYYTKDNAYLDGNGNLLLRAIYENDSLKTSYLRTFDWSIPKEQWTLFGANKGKYFEASVKLSDLNAGGLWCAFWLYPPENAYDENLETGTEIDIMENLVAYGKPGTWIENLPNGNSLNYFNVATHWGEGMSKGKFLNATDFNIDLRDGEFHQFGLFWAPNKLTYYLDGKKVYEISDHVSQSNNEALILSMEYDAPPGDAWGTNENIANYLNDLPSYFSIDYVRVYELK